MWANYTVSKTCGSYKKPYPPHGIFVLNVEITGVKTCLLYLQKYQEHIHGDSLDAVIELLQHTSELVSLFNDKLYIRSTEDSRLHKLNQFYNSISHWGAATEQKRNLFISTKLHFDLESMCLGFQAMVQYKLSKVPNAVMKPAIVNQDCVEYHFCQVHSCNGKNDNPTFLQQQSTQNSIQLGQTTVSPKSNASCNSSTTDTRLSIHSS